jgi:hypothetical protein
VGFGISRISLSLIPAVVMKKTLLLLPLALAFSAPATFAQKSTARLATPAPARHLSGRVTDAWGQPLPGVTVLLKGTTQGAATDSAGRYRLVSLPPRGGVLVFSFVGYETREHAVPTKGAVLNIVLRSDNKSLSEVVVTGVAPALQRHEVSYSAAAVTVQDHLQGKVAGVQITRESRKARRVRDAAPSAAPINSASAGYLAAPLAYPAQPEAGAAR